MECIWLANPGAPGGADFEGVADCAGRPVPDRPADSSAAWR